MELKILTLNIARRLAPPNFPANVSACTRGRRDDNSRIGSPGSICRYTTTCNYRDSQHTLSLSSTTSGRFFVMQPSQHLTSTPPTSCQDAPLVGWGTSLLFVSTARSWLRGNTSLVVYHTSIIFSSIWAYRTLVCINLITAETDSVAR